MNPSNASRNRAWADELESLGTIVLEDADDHALVVDAYRPWCAVRTPWGERDVFEKLQQLEADASEQNQKVRERCEIVYVGVWPPPQEACDAIDEAGARCGPSATRLIIHYSESQIDLVGGLTHFAGPDARCTAEFYGPLPDLNEDDVAHLIARGASVRQTAGWPSDESPDLDRIRRISELGLRVPVMWYVHRDNIDHVLKSADAMLFANYNAGVAFEPVCAHPRFTSDVIGLVPSAEDYTDLLIDAYKQFRHYDDVFEPLRSLIRNLRDGGWNRASDRWLPIRLRIDESGNIHEFRQLPWVPSTNAEAADDAGLVLAEPCHTCRWKTVCGGCENADSKLFGLVCDYRMLYLEFFVREMHRNLAKVVDA